MSLRYTQLLSLVTLITTLLLPVLSLAHSLNDSYLNLQVSEERIEGSLQLAIDDLEIALGLDSNGDQQITWGEVLTQQAAINRYIQQHLTIQRSANTCVVNNGDFLVTNLAGGTFLYIPLAISCSSEFGGLAIEYGLFTDVDQSHRGITAVTLDGQVFNQVFASNRTEMFIEAGAVAWQRNLVEFIYEGIWHIWIGIDHVLFIVAMLLGVVLHRRRSDDSSSEINTWTTLGLEVLKLVTAFTVAHSITLVIATLQWVALSPRLVESAIALTVVLSGINIVYPLFHKRHWQVAFGFGLIHGFGFANVLGDLNMSSAQFFTGLLGFNIGVEIGQLAIVICAAPLLMLLTKQYWTRRYGSVLAGLVIAQIGVVWFIDRI